MAKQVAILLLVIGMTCSVTCQTFQYSRGWTTGKRADPSDVGEPSDVGFIFSNRRGEDSEGVHCGLRKLRMLLRRNANDRVYHLPCDILDIFSKDVEFLTNAHKSHRPDFYSDNNNNNNNNNNPFRTSDN